jgi:hypothetical protein
MVPFCQFFTLASLPTFSTTGARMLAIVTCGGKVESTRSGLIYESNVIVTAIPATEGN